ncbi:MAG TPA: ATP-binding protein [Marmoricola sp.]|nr:ATP-binding protein [Marmoricola sp.]
MVRSLSLRLVLGGFLVLVLGAGALQAQPAGLHGIGQWPAGLAAGLLLLVRGRRRVPAGVLLLAVAVASMLLGGRPWDVAIGYGVAVTVGATLAVWTLEQGSARPPRLWSGNDLVRFCASVALGAFAGADIVLLVSLATGFGPPGALFVSTFIGTAASLGALLPFFLDCSPHEGQAGPTERAVAWALLLGATVAIFAFTGVPGTGFVLIPLLGWTALRCTMREALAQVLLVTVVSSIFTSLGHGPFAVLTPGAGNTHEVLGVLISLFVLDCVFIVVPLTMAVGQQQRKASEAFLEREKLQHVMSSATGMAIIGTDEFGRINLFNPGAEFLLGYTADEVMGRSPAIFHTHEEIATQAERLGVEPDFVTVSLAQAAKPKPWSADWEFRRKDGEIRSMSMTLTPVTDDHGNVTGYVSTVDDVTERVRSQEALVAALEAERSAVARLKEVDEVKDAFVSTVSHELRTPITNIVGYVELLEDGVYGAPSEEQLAALQRVEQNSERLLALVEDLLTLSRLDEPRMRLESRLIDLRRVLATVHDMLAPTLAARHLDFRVVVPQVPVAVNGDREKLERMVMNLAGNAVKYTPDGGRVVLHLHQQGASAVIEVRDTGLGIPPEELSSLFRRFYRSSVAEQRAIQGTGLGLSIVKSIATLHGGTVAVDSELGTGSTFRVVLPCLEPAGSSAVPAEAPQGRVQR